MKFDSFKIENLGPIFLVTLFLCGAFQLGCARNHERQAAEFPRTSPSTDASKPNDAAQDAGVLSENVNAYLDQLDRRMEELEARLESRGAVLRQETREQLNELQARREELNAKLDQLVQNRATWWDEWRSDMEASLDRLESEISTSTAK